MFILDPLFDSLVKPLSSKLELRLCAGSNCDDEDL